MNTLMNAMGSLVAGGGVNLPGDVLLLLQFVFGSLSFWASLFLLAFIFKFICSLGLSWVNVKLDIKYIWSLFYANDFSNNSLLLAKVFNIDIFFEYGIGFRSEGLKNMLDHLCVSCMH